MSTDSPTGRDDPPAGREPFGHRVRAARRRGLDPDERRRVMEAVALRPSRPWLTQFALMLGLSVIVAVMGISADSAAVVIGAMLLAPFMVPVMGVSAAITMALPRHLVRALLLVAVASLGSVLLAYLLAVVLPGGPLPDELTSRTSPDLRDLLVALAAGTAGAYATVRSDVSSSLPGVAVAVALVPPLAVIGMAWEAGRGDLTRGAALLYAANLSAIVIAAAIVFLLTGFVPPRRLRETSMRVVAGAALATALTIAVAIPLGIASVSEARAGQDRERVQEAVDGWLAGAGDDLDAVRIDGDTVRVSVSGPNPPPATLDLERTIGSILGPAARVEVRWTQTQGPPTEPAPEPVPDPVDDDARQSAVRAAVDEWLAGDEGSYDVEAVAVGDDQVRIDLTSSTPPPPVGELSDRLADELGLAVPVVVNWTQRTTFVPGDGTDAIDRVTSEAERVARDWEEEGDGPTVAALRYDPPSLTVDLVGEDPGDVAALHDLLEGVVPADTDVTVWFTERRRVAPTTAAPITTTTLPAPEPGG